MITRAWYWLLDGWDYLTDAVRGRSRGHGLHVRPAGEHADAQIGEHGTCCEDVPPGILHSHAHWGGCGNPDCRGCAPGCDFGELPPVASLVIPRKQVARWPGWDEIEIHHPRRGEPAQSADYSAVLAPHVIAGLEHASADETSADRKPVQPALHLDDQYILGYATVDDYMEARWGWLRPKWAMAS